MTDQDLASVLRERGIPQHGAGSHVVKDFFDLAEALLDRASVQKVLARLDRPTLAVLAAIGELGAPTAADIVARLASLSEQPPLLDDVEAAAQSAAAMLMLETESGRYQDYDSVRDQLASWPGFGLPGLAELAAVEPPAALEPVPDVDSRFIDRVAAERAFAAITSVTELLAEIEREPARELAKGGIALPDTKRLATAMAVDIDEVATFVEVTERAELVARETGSWMITEEGSRWLTAPTGARWSALAAAWYSRLPGDIRNLLAVRTHALWGQGLRAYIDWLYPAGGEWIETQVTVYTRDAELLGITANQSPSGPGGELLAHGVAAAEFAMTELLPMEVEQVYLQHDLSVVAPGPLTPAVDTRLRGLADVESRALASTYRVSTSSVNRAMAAGETRESLTDFLSSISLTGIPQPLGYLIDEASTRYGLVRIGAAATGAYVSSSDEQLLRTILVDQNLSPLGLTLDGARLVSRFAPDIVFWSLSDARYPVAAEDASGQIVSLRRQRATKVPAALAVDPVESLIERLRLGGEPEPEETGQAWLLRQLEVAIKARVALTVSVKMPNGSIVDYQLEPTAVASGRLRARDNKSAIERTLPLTSIASLGPALP